MAVADNFMDILQPYIDKGQVTLFNIQWEIYNGRQSAIYDHYILPRLNESKFLLIVDLDEFMWSKQEINLNNILKYCTQFSQIQVRSTYFGSNGHNKQPKSIVEGFTKKQKEYSIMRNCKYFINSAFSFSSLQVHNAVYSNGEIDPPHFRYFEYPWLILNHYHTQSREFWDNIKCTRGSSDHYRILKPEDFEEVDFNEVEDLELYEQNKNIINNKT